MAGVHHTTQRTQRAAAALAYTAHSADLPRINCMTLQPQRELAHVAAEAPRAIAAAAALERSASYLADGANLYIRAVHAEVGPRNERVLSSEATIATTREDVREHAAAVAARDQTLASFRASLDILIDRCEGKPATDRETLGTATALLHTLSTSENRARVQQHMASALYRGAERALAVHNRGITASVTAWFGALLLGA